MTQDDQRLIEAVYRRDFESFAHRGFLTLHPGGSYLPNWHLSAIAHVLDQVRRGQITRLIINMPPRHLKSITVSVAWPAYLLGLNPRQRIFVISYSNELADKHSSDFRSIVESHWYQRAFPNMRIRRSLEDEVVTTLRGFRKSTSVNGTLTGLGGNIFILDDPQKPKEALSEAYRNTVNQWVSHTLMSRLDSKQTGAVVLVMQRLHMQDLTGFLLEGPDKWTVLSLPAIAAHDEKIAIGDGMFHFRRAGQALHPEHESLESLRKQQQIFGPDVFAAQYDQCPVPDGGGMIKREWIQPYDIAPARTNRAKIIQSWDTAAKDGAQNDYSVGATFLLLDGHYYLLDITRGRYEYPILKATVRELANRFKPDAILIEDASTGTALASELRRDGCYAIQTIPIERDKVGRLYVQQAKFHAGLVHFPRVAPFMPELMTELLTFPQSKHDDQVDAISQALSYEVSIYNQMHLWVGGVAQIPPWSPNQR